jgi:hypothetical protein
MRVVSGVSGVQLPALVFLEARTLKLSFEEGTHMRVQPPSLRVLLLGSGRRWMFSLYKYINLCSF